MLGSEELGATGYKSEVPSFWEGHLNKTPGYFDELFNFQCFSKKKVPLCTHGPNYILSRAPRNYEKDLIRPFIRYRQFGTDIYTTITAVAACSLSRMTDSTSKCYYLIKTIGPRGDDDHLLLWRITHHDRQRPCHVLIALSRVVALIFLLISGSLLWRLLAISWGAI